MKETRAPELPNLWEDLANALSDIGARPEDTDPYINVPFTKTYDPDDLQLRRPAPPRLRTHQEYQMARAQSYVPPAENGLALRLDVGAWVPDRLFDDSDTVVVDINTIIAAERLIR